MNNPSVGKNLQNIERNKSGRFCVCKSYWSAEKKSVLMLCNVRFSAFKKKREKRKWQLAHRTDILTAHQMIFPHWDNYLLYYKFSEIMCLNKRHHLIGWSSTSEFYVIFTIKIFSLSSFSKNYIVPLSHNKNALISEEHQCVFRMNYPTDRQLLFSDFWLSARRRLRKCSFPESHPNCQQATLDGDTAISRRIVLPVTTNNNETFIDSYST